MVTEACGGVFGRSTVCWCEVFKDRSLVHLLELVVCLCDPISNSPFFCSVDITVERAVMQLWVSPMASDCRCVVPSDVDGRLEDVAGGCSDRFVR